ncbi:MAG TPA: TonB-dependent receptor [Sorangium sp.]|nr:TonB-dependent receptor [Sorangium sp.]
MDRSTTMSNAHFISRVVVALVGRRMGLPARSALVLAVGNTLSPLVFAQPPPPKPTAAPTPAPPAPAANNKPTPAPSRSGGHIVPPKLKKRVAPKYPVGETTSGSVVLKILVERNGHVGTIKILQSLEHHIDDAAVEAVRQWLFEPATRDGRPIKSLIRIRIDMQPPAPVLPLHTAPKSVAKRVAKATTNTTDRAPETEPVTTIEEETAPLEVVVSGHKPSAAAARGASEFNVDRRMLNAAPSQTGSDLLRRAPGVYIGRPEGAAVAQRYMLRGFDADHGQDLALHVGGLPINLPSHIHGQGYADLGFLIGEVVDQLHVSEGVYHPQQGDFAVAGSIDIELGIQPRGWLLKSSYGAFNSFRQLVLWAPHGAPRETFGAAQMGHTDGFGTNREGQYASAMFQARFGEGPWTYRTLGIVHAARAQLAGVVRSDDVARHAVDFYRAYPYPSAQQQNALSARSMLGLFADYAGAEGQQGQLGVWLGYDSFRLQENFTGFVQRSRTLDNVAGRGDLIEQQNKTTSAGISGRYRAQQYRPTHWARGTLQAGFSARVDVIDQAQNLIDANVRNQTWDKRIDAAINGGDIGMWAELDWSLSQYLRARVGVRADALFYDVDDRLGNFVPSSRPADRSIAGFRRSAFGIALGPRASLMVLPLPWLSFRAAYGEGYRSPQARTLEDGEQAPFTKVRSADLGATFNWGKRLKLTLAGYYTHLSDDVAFDAREGRLVRRGASQRLGAVVHAQSQPAPWLVSSFSLTVVDAQLLTPPPATAEDPHPSFVAGQRLPFVPPVVGRIDIGMERRLLDDVAGKPVSGRLGSGFSFLSPRPLPRGAFARPVGLLDAGAGVHWGPVGLHFDVFNLLNTQYAAIEFNFPSHWSPQSPPSRLPARHSAAGSPLSWTASLEVTL